MPAARSRAQAPRFAYRKIHMKHLVTAVLALAAATAASAGPSCNAPKDKWMNQEEFKKLVEKQGYQIKVFKITKGQCYEIYGLDKDGRKVEIYFDPATAAVIERK